MTQPTFGIYSPFLSLTTSVDLPSMTTGTDPFRRLAQWHESGRGRQPTSPEPTPPKGGLSRGSVQWAADVLNSRAATGTPLDIQIGGRDTAPTTLEVQERVGQDFGQRVWR